MVEISEKKYWKKLNYNDGLLYLSLLTIDEKDDWRMWETMTERLDNGGVAHEEGQWYLVDIDISPETINERDYWVVPVRDI
jgi:hypothetical protein